MNFTRRLLIAGNWKMFHGGPSGVELADQMAELAAEVPGVDVLIAPPFTALAACGFDEETTPLLLGAQNMHAQPEGAYTGEISAQMLLECGVRWVILGHSERRQHAGESDALIAEKTAAALAAGLSPIVCVGETLAQREAGQTLAVVKAQLDAVLAHLQGTALPVAIAYEPVWAIGTGKTAGPAEAEEVHAKIREWLGPAGAKVRILYGGSVKGDNARALLACPNVDGALVGGASLSLSAFEPIVRAAAQFTS